MITDLEIKNFAIIEHEVISFNSGMIVISGETGAGKSIILQALELILGAKADPKFIRHNCESFEIQAVFDISKVVNRDFLPDFINGEQLIISRSLNINGKSKIYVNGKIVTIHTLSEITSSIVDICKQGNTSRLLNQKYHLELLDLYSESYSSLEKYQTKYKFWYNLKNEISDLKSKLEKNALREIELQALIEIFEKIDFKNGLRAELETSIKQNANSEKIIEESNLALDLLNSNNGIYSQIISFNKIINNLSKYNIQINTLELEQLEEIEKELSKLSSSLEINPEELEEARNKLSEIAALERRFKTDESGLVSIYESAVKELEELKEPERIEIKEKLLKETELDLNNLANELSKIRKNKSKILAKQIQEELIELNMPNVKFEVEFESKPYTLNGIDDVHFMIATNKGTQLNKLEKVASGGELSRIMLVLKKILKEQTNVNVMIFDEIDTGISGKVARSVGEKLFELAKNSQVICITHLAQVASLANQHFLITKTQENDTYSKVLEITGDTRVNEIARMISGKDITNSSIQTAKELLVN